MKVVIVCLFYFVVFPFFLHTVKYCLIMNLIDEVDYGTRKYVKRIRTSSSIKYLWREGSLYQCVDD